ncbi:2'-5' RNA ligase family protein [Arthrobacter roseus]|uniref:2'-5' RNA ligase family protein n=1 Tax=Arthrobacter roseus TaxID=136274 RepID=UPI001EF7BF91|nr:2'-5' RNA ligase family protein [Arthrobacter roseus]MBM7847948.1 2'-5' RNA ligase [Arthrobacter roseus]
MPPARCIGIVIPIPDPLAGRLEEWRASFGDPMAAVVPPHITLITTTPAWDWTAVMDHVREAASHQEEFKVTLRGTGTFRPMSPVVYINVTDGFDACVGMHQRLQTGPLARELDFPYHPHVTVAHDVSEASMDTALQRLVDFEESFPVRSMGLFEHEAGGLWTPREELTFGR